MKDDKDINIEPSKQLTQDKNNENIIVFDDNEEKDIKELLKKYNVNKKHLQK